MGDLYLKAVFAGISFGIWPLLMNRSGLNGNMATAILFIVATGVVMPFAVVGGGIAQLATANWVFIVISSFLGGLGMLCFNGIITGSPPEKVGVLFVVVLVVQTIVPSVYHVVMSGQLPLTKIFGFLLAAISFFLLVI